MKGDKDMNEENTTPNGEEVETPAVETTEEVTEDTPVEAPATEEVVEDKEVEENVTDEEEATE